MSSNRGAEHAPWCPEDAVVGQVVVIEAALQLTMLGLVNRACSEALGCWWCSIPPRVLDLPTFGPSWELVWNW